MEKIKVSNQSPKTEDYDIIIGRNTIDLLNEQIRRLGTYSQIVIITDKNVAPHWLEKTKKAIGSDIREIILPACEKHKSIQTAQQIWQQFKAFGIDRKSLVINLGGGVIGDLGGFAAATYMRGIDFIQVPTTLLAQVDASVGGKVGVNEAGIKNLIGSFSTPRAVIIDPETLSTLPERELHSGYAEIIKHGLVADKNYFSQILDEGLNSCRAQIITDSCKIKAAIVTQDFKESGVRKILNFGHTVGHALESFSHGLDNFLLHGEAISLGMIVALRLSELKLGLEPNLREQTVRALESVGLPTRSTNRSTQELWSLMLSDKKNKDGLVNFVLLEDIASPKIDCIVDKETFIEAYGSIKA